MKEESIKAYSRRVTQANQTELIVILYDILLEDIQDAKEFFLSDNRQEGKKALGHARKTVKELIASLNFQYPIARELLSLYIYVNRCISYASISGKEQELSDAREVVEELRKAFVQVSNKDNQGPVMMHTQQLYAGLTYGRGTLNETMISDDEAVRGFFA